MKKDYIVRIIYQDRRTGNKHKVTFRYATDENHAMRIAKKLRPKYHKILLVYMGTALGDL